MSVSYTHLDVYKRQDKTYATDPTGIANNEDSYTMHANADKMQNDRVLGNILLTKVDLDAAQYLAADSNGDTCLLYTSTLTNRNTAAHGRCCSRCRQPAARSFWYKPSLRQNKRIGWKKASARWCARNCRRPV